MKTQNMGAMQIAYIVVNHALGVNLVMFFISVVSITAGENAQTLNLSALPVIDSKILVPQEP